MTTPSFAAIRDKVRAAEPLTLEDGVALFHHPNLLEVGALANEVRERLHGDRTYFNRNIHINATNVCEASCMFCSFARLEPGKPGAYTMSHDEAWGKLRARVAADDPITEIHIVNGLHPGLPFDYYTELLAGLKRIQPSIHLKAFTAVEIFYFAKKFGMPIADVIAKLRAAGLDSLPGGGAEIFAPRVRKKICDDKSNTEEWLEVHRVAHRMGLRSNCTMLYGHLENDEDRVDHLVRLRELQDETQGFVTYIPLAFHPDNTPLHHIPKTTGFTDIKNIAVARLMLDNIPHIKAYWVMMTPRIAQIALRFGADDIDGTIVEERIYHDAGATTAQGLRRGELLALIRKAGREPMERDTLYRRVQRAEATFTVLV